MTSTPLAPLRQAFDVLRHLPPPPWLAAVPELARTGLRFAARHSGVPALVIAAVFLVVAWKFLRRSARFSVEVALVTFGLLTMTALGWIRW